LICGATIVTWNLKDFKKAAKFAVQVVTPKDLLLKIGEL